MMKLVFAAAMGLAILFSNTSGYAMGSKRPAIPVGAIAANYKTVTPPEIESCEESSVYSGPKLLVKETGRLNQMLRRAARKADPMYDLHMSAVSFARGLDDLGRAFADLSVTGRKSSKRFRELHQNGALNESRLVAKLKREYLVSQVPQEKYFDASKKALDRAYKVLNVIHNGNSNHRPELGWIAVSGEDDQPYRPVNVPSAKYPQFDLTVKVGQHEVRTRYMIAESLKNYDNQKENINLRSLPKVNLPKLSSNAKVLIYVHGMDSRLEEAGDLAQALKSIATKRGENWTIISMDLPSSGYADKLDHRQISAISRLGTPRFFPPGFNAGGRQRVPVLDFIESFIVSFINDLDKKIDLKDKIEAVIGGSLGGNMTFRLGRRSGLPWLKNVVTWSPASIWDGLADGADIFKQIGVATAWKRAGGDTKNLKEGEDTRKEFFKEAFGGEINIGVINIVPAQPDQWWRKSWKCFRSSRILAEYDRYEIYNRNFRLWHWRLATEQLIYSHQKAPNRKKPRYENNHVRMLLACGTQDDFNFTNICSSTRKTAQKMINTPGRAIFLRKTGHSIHNERPNFFAKEIVKFLNQKK
jgi:pimeloyl-ACP methyl ester carboxylesterase